ncbi:MAG TPA: ClbS/DfsB family four-helix bundle protein [Cryomorphaceae bacterium]|nr:ClbS/DfsB family four-helix bundle protein [Cryomorphaceae bacterium]
MPRPKTKIELLRLAEENHQKLLEFIDQLSEEHREADFPSGTMNRNIRDVLAHLHHWHLMMLDWYRVGMSGKKPEIPARGYTWKTTPQLNRKIWEDHLNMPLNAARESFEKTHREVMNLVEKHSDEELFEKKRYKWTGTTSLGAYLISATSSHYDWALKLIKKAEKTKQVG